ncbi:MAG TPA: erythromycin esterase family protein [Rhizomicrobium sp.]|nr:erythromycin esterase family protein [Rhizomicrobium sp.]
MRGLGLRRSGEPGLPSRRMLLHMLAAAGTMGTAAAVAGGAANDPPPNPLLAALKTKAAAVRSLAFADDDFADLEPLGAAVGTARIVQLGEPSHGAGSAFAAKARIVKFLHLRHGFDVLVWESGFYDVALAQAAMDSPSIGAAAAARKGIFALWSDAAEVKPLFAYIKASQSRLHPLDIAGFDLQVTADGSRARFAQDLLAYAGALDDPAVRERAVALANAVLRARAGLYASKFSDVRDLEHLTAAANALRDLATARPVAFEAVHGELDSAFMGRALENARADAALRFDMARSPETTPARESGRDARNAANLRWLIEERYRGRKILVWAHNVHVMDAYYAPGFRALHLEERPGDMKPTGVFMKNWFGDAVYTIGITAFEGEEGFATGGPKSPIAPAPPGSLEAGLHALGHPFAFLDFRAIPRGSSPLRSRLALRAPKFDTNEVADAGRIYDGVFFIDRMAAATHI